MPVLNLLIVRQLALFDLFFDQLVYMEGYALLVNAVRNPRFEKA